MTKLPMCVAVMQLNEGITKETDELIIKSLCHNCDTADPLKANGAGLSSWEMHSFDLLLSKLNQKLVRLACMTYVGVVMLLSNQPNGTAVLLSIGGCLNDQYYN